MNPARPRGWTILELMVAVMIVALLAALSIPSYLHFMRKTREAEAVYVLGSIRDAQKHYLEDEYLGNSSAYAPDFETLRWTMNGEPGNADGKFFTYTMEGLTLIARAKYPDKVIHNKITLVLPAPTSTGTAGFAEIYFGEEE